MKSFSMLKMQTKVLLGFTCAALLAAFIGAIGDVNMKMLDSRDEALYGAATLSHQYLASASLSFQNLVLLNQKLRTDNSPESFTAAAAELEETGSKLQHDLREYAWMMTDKADQSSVVAASDACRKYIEDTKEYYRLGAAGNLYEAKQHHRYVLGADRLAIAANFARMSDANAAETMRMRDENAETLEAMRSLMLIVIGTVIVTALALGFFFRYAIARMHGDELEAEGELPAIERQHPGFMKADPILQQSMLRKNAPPARASEFTPALATASAARSMQEPKLAMASAAAQSQPAKKMRLYFDDTVEYQESESYQYR